PLVQLERSADELPVWDVIQPEISAGEFLPRFVRDAVDRLRVLEATGTGYPQSHPNRCQSAALTLMHHQQSVVIRSPPADLGASGRSGAPPRRGGNTPQEGGAKRGRSDPLRGC